MHIFRTTSRWAAAFLSAALAASAHAQCASHAGVDAIVDHYVTRTPATLPQEMDQVFADCLRAAFDKRLLENVGPLVGFKVALTSAAMQQRFGTDQPVWGRLYRGMLVPNGSTVETMFGAQPRFEADLLVRVGSAAIHQARTLEEVIASIDQVIPFIELPDLVVDAPQRLTASSLAAINAGARSGVMGEAIPVPRGSSERARLIEELRDMRVVVSDAAGVPLSQGRGDDMLKGHPLWSLVWLADALSAQSRQLRAGDIVSLGSFSPLLVPQAGMVGTVTYQGLSDAKPVTVKFK